MFLHYMWTVAHQMPAQPLATKDKVVVENVLLNLNVEELVGLQTNLFAI